MTIEKVLIDNSDYEQEVKTLLQSGTKFTIEDDVIKTSEFEFSFTPEFKPTLDLYKQFQNPLIYGKNSLLAITAIEVVNNQIHLFFCDGTLKTYPYRPWVLTERMVDTRCEKLDGILNYKYIRFFDSETDQKQFFFRNKHSSFQIWNAREAAMTLHGITMFKGLKPEDVGVLSFDIESAGLAQDETSEVYLITNVYTKDKVRIHKHFRLDNYSSQSEMLDDWCLWVRTVNPDILTAWNGIGYDLPYLNYVAQKNGTAIRLGRNGEEIDFIQKSREYRVDGSNTWTYNNVIIFGRHFVDGMFLAVKHDFSRKYPSWGLKAIAEFEKLKKPDRAMYDASKIRDNWGDPVEREKIVAYGIDDAEDSINLFELMIAPYFYTGQSIPKPFQDMMLGATGSWINSVMVRSYLQDNHSIPKASELGYLKGGISFGVPGVYRNVSKIDIKSAYPSQILRFKLYDKIKDPRGNFYQMVKFFAENRFYFKKMEQETGNIYWKGRNDSAKVFINSAYGALSTPGLNYNSPELASKITFETRQVIIQSIEWASGKGIDHWFPEYNENKKEEENEETSS